MTTTLIGRERVGNAELSSSKNQFTYTETYDYLVISNDANESYWDVLTTSGLPIVFMTDQGGMRCVSKSATRDPGHAGMWHVQCKFSAETIGQDTSSNDPDPETWVPIWTGTFEYYDEVIYQDYSASPVKIVNSANCKFPEPVTKKKPVVSFEFSQYEPFGVSITTLAARNDKINDGTFAGFATETLHCTVRAFTRGLYFGYPKTKVDYLVRYNPETWDLVLLDQGYEYFAVAATPPRVASPKLVSLDTDGTALDDDDTPLTKTFQIYDDIDFSTFLRT